MILADSPLPKGRLEVEDTIDLTDDAGLMVRGQGSNFSNRNRGTWLTWVGPPDRPMFRLLNISDSVFEDFLIDAEQPLQCGFLSLSETARRTTFPRFNRWRRVWVNGRTHMEYG